MAICIGFIFILALTAPLLQRISGRFAHWAIGAAVGGVAIYLAGLMRTVAGGETILEQYVWAPGLGLQLALQGDGLSLFMAIIISAIGSLIVIYAGAYMQGERTGAMLGYLLMFMGSMLGVALADDVVLFFIFWELTSLSSYVLIGFDHEKPSARSAALQALLVTGSGGLALLAGLLIMADVGGSMRISELLLQGDAIRSHHLYPGILTLILLGAFTKSAQFPFHFWLPNAMEAPTPVSAYLHSATMVKAGVFLLARVSPILGGTPQWTWTLMIVGGVTMIMAAAMAVTQPTLKRMLAYSTVSVLGTLVMLIGIGSPASIQAATVYLGAHAMYKGALFMIAGLITHSTGVSELTGLGGLWRRMPAAAVAGALAAASMIGLMPLFGFISKELLLEALTHGSGNGEPAWVLTAATIAASMLLFVVAISVGVKPFFGRAQSYEHEPHAPTVGLWFGPAILGLGGLALGLFPSMSAIEFFGPASAAIIGSDSTAPMKLVLWHGWNWILALSVLTLIGGVGVFLGRSMVMSIGNRLAPFAVVGPQAAYHGGLALLMKTAAAQTRILQSGYLRMYLLLTMLAAIGAIGFKRLLSLREHGMLPVTGDQAHAPVAVRFYEIILALVILGASYGAVRTSSRLAAVAFMGVVGYGVALIFVFYGAPDLAMTQFLIETLIVVLLLLVLYHLPRYKVYSAAPAKVRDAIVAISFGTLMGSLVLAAQLGRTHPAISSFFAERSYLDAHGRNVVNVILVDFRAIDTLGEITVISTAAIGVLALLKLRLRSAESSKPSAKNQPSAP